MGPVRIRHSSHDFATQSSHSVDLARWQEKMASIEIWIPWRNALKPHWYIPGHAGAVQASTSVLFPSQSLPVPTGVGLLHSLCLRLSPSPHVTEQVDHTPHVDHIPLTEKWNELKERLKFSQRMIAFTTAEWKSLCGVVSCLVWPHLPILNRMSSENLTFWNKFCCFISVHVFRFDRIPSYSNCWFPFFFSLQPLRIMSVFQNPTWHNCGKPVDRVNKSMCKIWTPCYWKPCILFSPGQSVATVQFVSSTFSPIQSCPPFDGAGFVQLLRRSALPDSQVAEQLDQELQEDHWPLTVEVTRVFFL